MRNQLLPMIDGPYYLIQVRSLLTTGGLVYGDPPLTFYLLSLFSVLLGDITLGVKVGASFFCALSTIPAYFLMKKIGKSILAGLIAMLLVVFSAPYIRMLTDFMKNAVGVCWLFAFIYYLHDLAFIGIRKSSLALAAFFLVLTGLTHILDFGIALVFLVFYTVMVLISNDNRRPFLKAVGIIALVISAFVFIASTFFSFLFSDFTKVLSFFQDLTAPKGSEVPTPTPPSPMPTPVPQPLSAQMDAFSIVGLGTILLILSVGTVLSLYVWKKKDKEALLLLSVTTIAGFIMCLPLIPSEWLSRFQLMTVIPSAIILSYGISEMWNLTNTNSKFVAMVLFVISLSFFVAQSVGITTIIRPTISDAGYLDLVNIKNQIPSDSIIAVSDYGIRYWVEYVDEVDTAQGRIDELSPDLWQSYSHALGLLFKNQVPRVPFKTIFVGNVFTLVELQQNNYSDLSA
ncbi:glycosyltransferase family 39 protein [Candidatus Bathyarchaeota archaeon]|nr:glycosyltransferase family 39 protein [Candidatus Bathyarchaeota archaeon]